MGGHEHTRLRSPCTSLTRLIGERLVTGISQRGYRVAPMSISELEAIYDARAELEGLLIRLAIERGDDEWEATVLARTHTLAKVTRVQDADEMLERWDTRHQALHDAMVAGCGCLPLLQSRAALFDQAQRYRHLWLRQTVFSEQALAEKQREYVTAARVVGAEPIDQAGVSEGGYHLAHVGRMRASRLERLEGGFQFATSCRVAPAGSAVRGAVLVQ